MEEEGIVYTSLHHIDIEKNSIRKIDLKSSGEEILNYIKRFIEEVRDKPSKRSYFFESESTEVRSTLSNVLSGDHEAAAEIIAKRLLKVERMAQDKMNASLKVGIQKGSLFQAVIQLFLSEQEVVYLIIIGKADHSKFIDATDFLSKDGMPWKKKIFKSFSAILSLDNTVRKVSVTDTAPKVVRYWWDGFLELTPERSDAHNTDRFLELMDKKGLNKHKIKYPADHTIIRNAIIGYFRTHETFALEALESEIFREYSPVDPKFPIKDVAKAILSIPTKYDVDGLFSIDPAAINKRSSYKIKLNDGMDLTLGKNADLSNVQVELDQENNKYVRIRSDEGYNRFKKPNGSQG